MKKHVLMAVVAGSAIAASATAEMIRPTLTLENLFPEVGHAEVGGSATFTEFSDDTEQFKVRDANMWLVTPAVRYMALENLAVLAEVPFGSFDPDDGDSESGLGDIAVGLQLRVYEHFFRFPYVIPHMKYKFDTASDDIGLGDGESSFIIGTTIGSRVYDKDWLFNADISYEIFDDSENVASIAGSAIWEVSERFALLAEVKLTDEEQPVGSTGQEHPMLFGGGMTYKATDRCTVALYGAGAKNAKEDVITTLRCVYQF